MIYAVFRRPATYLITTDNQRLRVSQTGGRESVCVSVYQFGDGMATREAVLLRLEAVCIQQLLRGDADGYDLSSIGSCSRIR